MTLWVARLIRNQSVLSSNAIKGSGCFLEQETLIVWYWLVPRTSSTI